MDGTKQSLKPESWLIAGGRGGLRAGDPLNVPLVPASNFTLGAGRGYARDDGTPTWEALEDVVGGLEIGKSLAYASGMAAIAAVFDQLSAGARIVLPDDCYQGVASLASAGERKGHWSVQRVAVEDTQAWIQASETADLIWLESPSNPLLTVADLPAICAAPRKRNAILAVDNTFATPINQRPLDLGATVSIQSATKFIGGHSDLLSGIATTRDEAFLCALRSSRELCGATPGALECFLAVRGARTLSVRLERAQDNAGDLARRLQAHPNVSKVRYPGLPTHATHEVAKRVLDGFGSLISFDVSGGANAADAVCRTTELIRHATSLGAVESTLERRAALPGQQHIPPGLVRLSVGIENVNDLWRDLDAALLSSAA